MIVIIIHMYDKVVNVLPETNYNFSLFYPFIFQKIKQYKCNLKG